MFFIYGVLNCNQLLLPVFRFQPSLATLLFDLEGLRRKNGGFRVVARLLLRHQHQFIE